MAPGEHVYLVYIFLKTCFRKLSTGAHEQCEDEEK